MDTSLFIELMKWDYCSKYNIDETMIENNQGIRRCTKESQLGWHPFSILIIFVKVQTQRAKNIEGKSWNKPNKQ